MSAPSLDAARVALRAALDELARAHRDAAGVCAVYANALALGDPTESVRSERLASRKRLLCAEEAFRVARRALDTAEAHARLSGDLA